jgi:hypothetical protein
VSNVLTQLRLFTGQAANRPPCTPSVSGAGLAPLTSVSRISHTTANPIAPTAIKTSKTRTKFDMRPR